MYKSDSRADDLGVQAGRTTDSPLHHHSFPGQEIRYLYHCPDAEAQVEMTTGDSQVHCVVQTST